MNPRKIHNAASIATTDLRKDALMIAEAGYTAIDTGAAIRERLSLQGDTLSFGMYRYPITGRVRFVGIGKCAIAAAQAVEEILGERLADGIALDVSPIEGVRLSKITTYIGTHPHPTDINLEATARIVEFLASGREDDLVLMLISGGGSTLLCLHDAPMTCMDESVLLDELTRRGVPIEDINAVRKHLSQARGGGLAAAAYPARVVALIVSDVPGDDIASIASGPTTKDETTAAHAQEVLARHGITPPPGAIFLETPKDDRYFERIDNILFLSSQDALAAMQERARDCGYTPVVVDAAVRGEARELGERIAQDLRAAPSRHALLYAGETTVTLHRHDGAGGRSQEIALGALPKLGAGELVLPFASDGHDNCDRAGAIADSDTTAHASAKGLSAEWYLASHKSYDFFTASGDYLLTGYTGSNVSDLVIALKK